MLAVDTQSDQIKRSISLRRHHRRDTTGQYWRHKLKKKKKKRPTTLAPAGCYSFVRNSIRTITEGVQKHFGGERGGRGKTHEAILQKLVSHGVLFSQPFLSRSGIFTNISKRLHLVDTPTHIAMYTAFEEAHGCVPSACGVEGLATRNNNIRREFQYLHYFVVTGEVYFL